ncbi:MAG: ribonuclease III, partial [Methanobacterium sp.]|nr:ribonuclease III [Methanobacterium sp.]
YTHSTETGQDTYIKIGARVESTTREIDSVISNVFESFIGALYLDSGLETTKRFLAQTVIPHIHQGDIFFYDYKSQLKHLCDQKSLELSYELIKEVGEPHDKIFTMVAVINGKRKGTGTGGSKKEAEQNAAKFTLGDI